MLYVNILVLSALNPYTVTCNVPAACKRFLLRAACKYDFAVILLKRSRSDDLNLSPDTLKFNECHSDLQLA
eukprot:6215902-Amphidinium_carterae.1